jgi:hypothetical protein
MGFYMMVAAAFIVVWVLPIWFSVKAKPIGTRPYRWGTYVGILSGLCTLPLALLGWKVFLTGNVLNMLIFCILVVCGLLACAGILRRRRFGPVMFPLFFLLVLAIGNSPSPSAAGNALGILILVGVTSVYFGKRWRFMTAPVDNAESPGMNNVSDLVQPRSQSNDANLQ